MKIASETVGDVIVFDVPGERLAGEEVTAFRRAIDGQLEGGKVVFDLTRLDYIDSSGLGAILACLRRLEASGGGLKLCNASAAVRPMLELVRFHRIMELHESRDEAVRSYAAQG